MEIAIFDKSGNLVASVVVGSNSYTLNEIMGDAYLQLEFALGEYVDIRRDSYCVYNGVRYTLIKAVNVEKISTVEYNYSARFEAPQELLENIIMSHMAGEGQITTKAYERNFSISGKAHEHIEMLLRNTAERLHTNFHIGTIDSSLTGVKTVAYNVVSCKSALQLIANAFECEWWVSGNESEGYAVNLGKCSFNESNPTKLAYGHDNGVLGGTKRQLHKDAQRMTHIAVQGGSQNINTLSQLPDVPPYKFSTLHLPKTLDYDDTTGIGHIFYDVRGNKFEGETGFNMATSVLLTIDRNANTMTSSLFNEAEDVIVERAFDLSEFYPKKSRFVSAFSFQRNNTEFYIEDSSIEDACDYKHYQLGGEKITIVFQTGALAGKTFDVINYDHENRRFECALADYDTISMPSVDEVMWRPVVGEEFIVYGTALPKSYFADMSTDPFSGAEWEMARRTASILCENFNDKYAYSLTIDSNWLSRRTTEQRNALKCGFWVHFVDNQLAGGGVDIRITAVKEYLTRPLQPELTIGDEVKTVSIAQKLQQIQSSVSATYNYVQNVQEQTQRDMDQVDVKVDIEQILMSGVETARINGISLYAPQGGGGGSIADVQVNGQSVVQNNIANIALSTYLNSYATQSWVEEKGYLTSASLNGYATQNWVNQQGFLKSVPSSYATQSWVQSNFALKTDVPTKLSDIQNDSNLYVSSIYISDISAQGSWVKYAFSANLVDTGGVPLKAGDYLLNGTQLWRVDVIGGNVGYCINAGVQIMPTIDTSAPETPADDHVPSTKLLADQLKIVAEMFNGLANSKADKSMLNNYYNKTEIDENYYNKAYLNVVFSAFASKSDIEEMCKRIVVKSSKTFSVEELKGVGEILVKPSANMQIILPNDAVAIAGDRITISVIPANNTAGVDIATQTTTLYHNSAGYITTMSVVYIGSGWRLWDVQWTTM